MNDQVLGGGRIKRVAFGAAIAFPVYIAGAGITACSQLLIARIVGAETYGIYAYVIAWMTILGYVSALGFNIALLRFVPTYQTLGAWGLARGVIQYAERRVLAVSLLVIFAGTLVVANWPWQLS